MKSRGFSLVEVMVALIIVSVGLLGIAKMQALALSSTGTARLRSLAALEAASLAASMHADRAYWAAGATAAPITITGTSAGPTISDTTLATITSCTQSGATRPTACTAAQMAAEDLQQWAGGGTVTGGLQTLLPNYLATISCENAAGAPVTCTITIQWSEHLVNINKQEAVAAATPSPYVLLVEP
jgi:type IV pilus assembly protein PilV